jgi:hypothetical protein
MTVPEIGNQLIFLGDLRYRAITRMCPNVIHSTRKSRDGHLTDDERAANCKLSRDKTLAGTFLENGRLCLASAMVNIAATFGISVE